MLVVIALLALTVILALFTDYEKSYITPFILTDSLTITHLASYIGAFSIAIFTPIYFVLKRRSLRHFRSMLKIHVLSNLLAFALITAHLTHREINSKFMGTGFVLYIAVFSLVVTGIIQRFNFERSKKPDKIRPHKHDYSVLLDSNSSCHWNFCSHMTLQRSLFRSTQFVMS